MMFIQTFLRVRKTDCRIIFSISNTFLVPTLDTEPNSGLLETFNNALSSIIDHREKRYAP